MSTTTPTQIRIETNTKKQANELFATLGMDMSGAVNIFLNQCILRGGIPFQIEVPRYGRDTEEAIAEARKLLHDNHAPTYHSMAEYHAALAGDDQMYGIRITSKYAKSYKRMRKRGMDMSLLDDVVDCLRQGKLLAPKYKDHALSGNYKGFRECHIKPDWLLVYAIDKDVLVLVLSDTGTHADIFGL